MMSAPYVLADDLTGALEAGAAFHAGGWRVVLPLREEESAVPEAGMLQAISTETRTADGAVAAATVRRVLARQRAAGARLLFKKIDSTLRGPLGAELRALAEELMPPLIVFCPANPAAGRTVEGGVLLVNGVPLERTEFRHDPAWPAETGDIRSRLSVHGAVVHAQVSLAALRAGPGAVEAILAAATRAGQASVVVSDAATPEDLDALVRATRAVEPAAVFVGSGALGAVLARLLPVGARPPLPTGPVASVLVLCGSRHPASHRQIEQLGQTGGAVVMPVDMTQDPAGFATRARLVLARHKALAICADAAGSLDSAALTVWLARLAAVLCSGENAPAALVLTGGETAHAACRALGGRSLEIVRELAGGVVLNELRRQSLPDVKIVTKPGGYGTDDTLVLVVDELVK